MAGYDKKQILYGEDGQGDLFRLVANNLRTYQTNDYTEGYLESLDILTDLIGKDFKKNQPE